MPEEISIDESDVRDALDGDADDSYTFEVEQAQVLVNDEVVPAAAADTNQERLELVATLVAAAYAKDDGDGNLSSVTQGTAQISWNNDDALTFWQRAVQMDPTNRLQNLEKETVSISVPDVRS